MSINTPEIAVAEDIIQQIKNIAEPGKTDLEETTLIELQHLTKLLLESRRSHATSEYRRFVDTKKRGLDLLHREIYQTLAGKKILVTGGTGCIGSVLLSLLPDYEPAQIASFSRGITQAPLYQPEVIYLRGDIRDTAAVQQLLEQYQPDLIFHLAAQREPGLAERDIINTFSTNVMGTKNLIDQAQQVGVSQLVHASTGKAVRFYSPDAYASSKKWTEWLLSRIAAEGSILLSGVRFTHVVDNSLIFALLNTWIEEEEPIRLHGSHIAFYAQSALESAQLLLAASAEAQAGMFTLFAIRDLGWPISLLDLSLGALAQETQTTSPIYFAGYEAGYEKSAYPGMYDPLYAGEVSPLISASEAPISRASVVAPQLDIFPVQTIPSPLTNEVFQIIEDTCDYDHEDTFKELREVFSLAVLDELLWATSEKTLARLREIALPYRKDMTAEHARVLGMIESVLDKR